MCMYMYHATISTSLVQIGTGFKDEDLEAHTNFFKDHIIDRPKAYYSITEVVAPDHWFDAVQVWEVKAADLSISPVYTASAGIESYYTYMYCTQGWSYMYVKRCVIMN